MGEETTDNPDFGVFGVPGALLGEGRTSRRMGDADFLTSIGARTIGWVAIGGD